MRSRLRGLHFRTMLTLILQPVYLLRGMRVSQWLRAMIDHIVGRFRREVTRADSRPIRIVATEPPQPKPEDLRAARAEVLCDWASTKACRDTFIPYIKEEMARIDKSMAVNAAALPEESIRVLLGERRRLAWLLEEFNQWTGQAGPHLAPVEEE